MVSFVFKTIAITATLCLIVTLLLTSNELQNGGVTLVIPKPHTAPVYNLMREGVWIYMSYPEFTSLEIEKSELQGLTAAGKAIDFFLRTVPADKLKSNALSVEVKKNKADLKAGEEFGLTVYKQSDAKYADKPNIWVDNETAPSFIVCQDGEDAKKSVCSHYLYLDNFYALIFYPRTELKNWQKIKNNVDALYQSYKNHEEAQ